MINRRVRGSLERPIHLLHIRKPNQWHVRNPLPPKLLYRPVPTVSMAIAPLRLIGARNVSMRTATVALASTYHRRRVGAQDLIGPCCCRQRCAGRQPQRPPRHRPEVHRGQQQEARPALLWGNIPASRSKIDDGAHRARNLKEIPHRAGRLRLFSWSKAPERLRRGRNSRNRTAARGLIVTFFPSISTSLS